MSIVNILNGKHDEDEEIALGMPDSSEAQSLERHVDRCAMRYRLFTSRLKSQGKDVTHIKLILYGIAVWLLATSPFAQDMLKRLMGVAP